MTFGPLRASAIALAAGAVALISPLAAAHAATSQLITRRLSLITIGTLPILGSLMGVHGVCRPEPRGPSPVRLAEWTPLRLRLALAFRRGWSRPVGSRGGRRPAIAFLLRRLRYGPYGGSCDDYGWGYGYPGYGYGGYGYGWGGPGFCRTGSFPPGLYPWLRVPRRRGSFRRRKFRPYGRFWRRPLRWRRLRRAGIWAASEAATWAAATSANTPHVPLSLRAALRPPDCV